MTQLPTPELTQFTAWFEAYQADLWDKQSEQDAVSGRLDALADEFGVGLQGVGVSFSTSR